MDVFSLWSLIPVRHSDGRVGEKPELLVNTMS
jgi:hypothetical protein